MLLSNRGAPSVPPGYPVQHPRMVSEPPLYCDLVPTSYATIEICRVVSGRITVQQPEHCRLDARFWHVLDARSDGYRFAIHNNKIVVSREAG